MVGLPYVREASREAAPGAAPCQAGTGVKHFLPRFVVSAAPIGNIFRHRKTRPRGPSSRPRRLSAHRTDLRLGAAPWHRRCSFWESLEQRGLVEVGAVNLKHVESATCGGRES